MVGVPVTPALLASSVTCSVHARYVPSLTQPPKSSLFSPTPAPMSISWSLLSPALPSGGLLGEERVGELLELAALGGAAGRGRGPGGVFGGGEPVEVGDRVEDHLGLARGDQLVDGLAAGLLELLAGRAEVVLVEVDGDRPGAEHDAGAGVVGPRRGGEGVRASGWSRRSSRSGRRSPAPPPRRRTSRASACGASPGRAVRGPPARPRCVPCDYSSSSSTGGSPASQPSTENGVRGQISRNPASARNPRSRRISGR